MIGAYFQQWGVVFGMTIQAATLGSFSTGPAGSVTQVFKSIEIFTGPAIFPLARPNFYWPSAPGQLVRSQIESIVPSILACYQDWALFNDFTEYLITLISFILNLGDTYLSN